jgi:hypothetical protein
MDLILLMLQDRQERDLLPQSLVNWEAQPLCRRRQQLPLKTSWTHRQAGSLSTYGVGFVILMSSLVLQNISQGFAGNFSLLAIRWPSFPVKRLPSLATLRFRAPITVRATVQTTNAAKGPCRRASGRGQCQKGCRSFRCSGKITPLRRVERGRGS